LITQEYLKSLLSYNPDTGIFIWLENRRRNLKGKIAGNLDNGYINIRIDGKNYGAHRLAWLYMTGEWPYMIDHEDMCRNNNKWTNLRLANNSTNAMNIGMRSNNKSGYKGVCYNKAEGRYVAQCYTKDGKAFLGYFDCPIEASKAYEDKAKELHGEFYRKGD
jgi:hypothetical protein